MLIELYSIRQNIRDTYFPSFFLPWRSQRGAETQNKMQVPAADMVTQFRHAEAFMERAQERGLLCLSGIQREIFLSQWDLSFCSSLPKVSGTLNPSEWHRDKEASQRPDERWLLPFPFKLPYWAISCIHHAPPLPDPGRHCCISSATTPATFWQLIRTTLPSVTGPTLKSHQSSLLRREPLHQQDSFLVLMGQRKQGYLLLRTWPHTQTLLRRKGNSQPMQVLCTSSWSLWEDDVVCQLADGTCRNWLKNRVANQ